MNDLTELIEKFIIIYKDVKIDRYDLIYDLREFIKLNTGELMDFRTVKGREILTQVFLQIKNVT